MHFIQRLWLYCKSKVSEVAYLDRKDLIAASLIVDIQSRKIEEKSMFIDISDLLYLHAIDRDTALAKVKERESVLRKYPNVKKISKVWMKKHLSSITFFKAVAYGNKYVVYEGNGRLMALKKVYKRGVQVEVDLVVVSGLEKKIRKVRRMNKLE